MTAVTLTAGTYFGAANGYSNGTGFPPFGSISGQPLAGQTLLSLYTSGSAKLYLDGDSTSLSLTLKVNGATWTLGAGNFDGIKTDYTVTPSGGGFTSGVSYTVDLTVGGGGPTPTPRFHAQFIGA